VGGRREWRSRWETESMALEAACESWFPVESRVSVDLTRILCSSATKHAIGF